MEVEDAPEKETLMPWISKGTVVVSTTAVTASEMKRSGGTTIPLVSKPKTDWGKAGALSSPVPLKLKREFFDLMLAVKPPLTPRLSRARLSKTTFSITTVVTPVLFVIKTVSSVVIVLKELAPLYKAPVTVFWSRLMVAVVVPL